MVGSSRAAANRSQELGVGAAGSGTGGAHAPAVAAGGFKIAMLDVKTLVLSRSSWFCSRPPLCAAAVSDSAMA